MPRQRLFNLPARPAEKRGSPNTCVETYRPPGIRVLGNHENDFDQSDCSMVTAPTILWERPIRNLPLVVPRGIEREIITGRLSAFLDFAQDRIEEDCLVLLLDADGLVTALEGRRDSYSRWVSAISNVVLNDTGLESLTRLANQAESALQDLFNERAEMSLGSFASRSLNASLDLQRLVRESLLEMVQAAAEHPSPPSQVDLDTFVTARDLCSISVAHHLSTGYGRTANAVTLASWSFHYADLASTEVGFLSLDLGLWTKLER